MDISLTAELEAVVTKRVQSGLYGSASEVVRDALRLLTERDRLRDLRFLELRRESRSEEGDGSRFLGSCLCHRALPDVSAAGRSLTL